MEGLRHRAHAPMACCLVAGMAHHRHANNGKTLCDWIPRRSQMLYLEHGHGGSSAQGQPLGHVSGIREGSMPTSRTRYQNPLPLLPLTKKGWWSLSSLAMYPQVDSLRHPRSASPAASLTISQRLGLAQAKGGESGQRLLPPPGCDPLSYRRNGTVSSALPLATAGRAVATEAACFRFAMASALLPLPSLGDAGLA